MKESKKNKIFVLDTSVIIYNHASIFSFEDNDIAIPITILEELDQFKKGNDIKNFEAREFSRIIDKLSAHHTLQDWIPLGEEYLGNFRVVFGDKNISVDACEVFGEDKPDHRILNAVTWLQDKYPTQQVILVTKDINLRIKAKALNMLAEDYETGKIKNIENLYSGVSKIHNIDKDKISLLYEHGSIEPELVGIETPVANHYYILKNGSSSVLSFFNPNTQLLEKLDKRPAYRITPRNAEQVFALHAIMNPDIKLVTLQGVAGTGKTLLALAGALEQKRFYKQVFLARPIVPLSNKDIGFLPGDIKSKLNPYMEPLFDNLKFIRNMFSEQDKEFHSINEDLESEKLVIQPLAYIRGRSLSDICFIVDEAQNLTPHEVKTIITRAGENTKIIFTGDIFQIDTPYLDAQSNGLSYLIDRIKEHPLYAHIKLEKGERSELANLANDLL
ncbi:MAG: PhoH family protein [Bacteroidales bacterium]|nr:PhoH family protein [Bacteroidales bacterium]MDD4575900.1 PhoH family protein [Bacteroidales bacterium]